MARRALRSRRMLFIALGASAALLSVSAAAPTAAFGTPACSPLRLALPSPAPPSHLTTGGRLTNGVNSVQTAAVSPDQRQTVFGFVLLAMASSEPTPAPTITGGGTAWSVVSVARANASAPRAMFAFRAAGPVRPGPLTISFPMRPRYYVQWSFVQSGGTVGEVVSVPPGNLVRAQRVSLSAPPESALLGAFAIGQPGGAIVDAPGLELGHDSTSLTTIVTGVTRTQSMTARWSYRAAHSMAIGIEIC